MSNHFDVAVLGGGPGGVAAALRGAAAGLRVSCFDDRKTFGGTCLNIGCIPTKCLLNMTNKYKLASDGGKTFGYIVQSASPDFGKMQANKDKVVTQLAKGVDFLFKKNKVTPIHSRALLKDSRTIHTSDGQSYTADHIILATGSSPANLPGNICLIDEKRILSSTGLLAVKSIPKTLLIIGGGAIGLEFASVFARLGTKVEVIEFLPRVAQGVDADVANVLVKNLQKQGIRFNLGHKVTALRATNDGVDLTASGPKGNVLFKADLALIAVGRRPNSEGLDKVGIAMNRMGQVEVGPGFRTSIPHIRAIGDLVPGPMLAHKADIDGVHAMDSILGKSDEMPDYSCCPAIIYTTPEIGSVGSSEDDLKKQGIKYVKGHFPFTASPRAKANLEDFGGFVKVLATPDSGQLLGASVITENAGDMIQTLVTAKKFSIPVQKLASIIYPHPDLIEGVKEACLAAPV